MLGVIPRTVLLAISICATQALANEDESEFIPAWDFPADATQPSNQRPTTTSAKLPLRFLRLNSDRKHSTDLHDDQNPGDSDQQLADEKIPREFGIEINSRIESRWLRTTRLSDGKEIAVDANADDGESWATWDDDDAEFFAKVACVVEGEILTNHFVLHRYSKYLVDAKAKFKQEAREGVPGRSPRDYVEFRNTLVKREIRMHRLRHSYAVRMKMSLSQSELQDAFKYLKEKFNTVELPRILNETKVKSVEEFEGLFQVKGNNLELVRRSFNIDWLATWFLAQHLYLVIDPDAPLGSPASSNSQVVEGSVIYDDETPVTGAVISVPEGESQILISENDTGRFRLQVPKGKSLLQIDFRDASDWPHEVNTDDVQTTSLPRPVVDSLLVRRSSSEPKLERMITIPRTEWSKLTLNWRGKAGQKLITVFVTPFQQSEPDASRPFSPETAELDHDLRFVRSFAVMLEKDQKVVIPHLPPGRCVVTIQGTNGNNPSAQSAILPTTSGLEFSEEQTGVVVVHAEGFAPLVLGKQKVLVPDTALAELSNRLHAWKDSRSDAIAKTQEATVQDDSGEFEKLQFELRMSAPGWRPGFLIHTSIAEDVRRNVSWTPDSDVLYPGQYTLSLLNGQQSKLVEFEIKPGEVTKIHLKREDWHSSTSSK